MNLDNVAAQRAYQQRIEINLQALQVLIDRLKAEALIVGAATQVAQGGTNESERCRNN